MPVLNYDQYSPEVRDRVQQRLQAPRASAPTAGVAPGPTDPATPAPPQSPFDIEQWGTGWRQSGGRTNQDFANYVGGHPLGAGYSLTGNNKDRISGPNGYTRDAVIAAGLGGQGAQWLDTTQQTPAGAAPGAAAMPTNPWIAQIRQMLLQRLQADQQPVDANAPQIAEPYNAASLAAQRSQEGEKRDLAERLYAQGDVNSGALNQGIQQSAERNAVGLAGIKSQLIQREYQTRRADLNDAMQQALASGDAELARQIQMTIANLDATVRREGYGVSLAENTADNNARTVLAAR